MLSGCGVCMCLLGRCHHNVKALPVQQEHRFRQRPAVRSQAPRHSAGLAIKLSHSHSNQSVSAGDFTCRVVVSIVLSLLLLLLCRCPSRLPSCHAAFSKSPSPCVTSLVVMQRSGHTAQIRHRALARVHPCAWAWGGSFKAVLCAFFILSIMAAACRGSFWSSLVQSVSCASVPVCENYRDTGLGLLLDIVGTIYGLLAAVAIPAADVMWA